MSKYIIDVGEGYIRHGLERTLAIPVRINEHEDHWMDTRIPVTPYTEPDLEQVRKEAYDKGYDDAAEEIGSDEHAIADKAYNQGLADAWEVARKVADTTYDVEWKIFDCCDWDVVKTFTASEAIEKIRQYEQEQEEQIQVGDEVITDFGKAAVIGVGPVHFEYFYAGGSGFDEVKNAKKTGRHFPEIAAVLEKMREEQE